MKYIIVFVFVLFFTNSAFAQESELNYSPLNYSPNELDNGVATVENKPTIEQKREEKVTLKAAPQNACLANKIKYLQSASRKLYRAISGKGYKIKKIGLKSFNIGDQRFEVIPEKDGKVLGVLNSSHPFGYLAINTTRGHIIAKMKWKNCRPIATTIVSPRVPTPNVDIEPFKYWGLRVLWMLPNRLGKTKNIKKSITNIIKAD